MTYKEAINDYLTKVGKVALDGEHLEQNEHGFISYTKVGDVLIVPDLYGDGRYWLQRSLEIAKELGCKRMRGGTTRNIKAYCRMFGLKVVGYIVEREV